MSSETWPSLKEFFSLLWINFTFQLRSFWEYLKVIFSYYSNLTFLKADLSLRLMYLFHNPYTISKRFLKNKGEKEIYAYGETPLSTMEKIAAEAHISSEDVVYELGCGRGRTCFWLNSFLKCRVVGVEYVPEFVERANKIKHKLGFNNIEFRLGDMVDANFEGASVIYLYGTCLEDELIRRLNKHFAALPAGTKIVSVSYPLNDFADKPFCEVMKRFKAKFGWGETDVYLQIVKKIK